MPIPGGLVGRGDAQPFLPVGIVGVAAPAEQLPASNVYATGQLSWVSSDAADPLGRTGL